MKNNMVCQGAEAIVYLDKSSLIKDRIAKSYRLPQLDEKLRKSRTKKEIKLLEKSSKLIPVPKVFSSSNYKINMEYIKGKKLSEYLDSLPNPLKISEQIGKNIALLHDKEIIHGDLTTSNMLLKEVERQGTLVPYVVYFIDFGLGFESNNIEDKAVDLHLIKQALEAKHFQHYEKYWLSVLKGYKLSKKSPEVLKRLEKVEKRGRYKQAY